MKWKLIKSPSHVKTKVIGKVNKFTGDEYSLKWGELLLGESDGNISQNKKGNYLSIVTPEGTYLFQKESP